MAKSKQSSRNRPVSKAYSSRQPQIADPLLQGATGRSAAIVWGLLLARWMSPTEGTVEGDTLWLTSLTLAAAAGFCWWKSRVALERLRFEKLDIAVWFLCSGHILSSLIVILTEGNKRAATNMLWEWLAVAVTFSLIRQTITLQSRTRFLETVLVITTALACYGIWQPAFWYPANILEYDKVMAELESVESSPDMPSQERAKRQMELRAECVSLGIPLSGPAQQLFERRLRDSREPLGFFALTNTLASFMTVAVVLLAGTLLNVLLPSRAGSQSTELNNRGLVCVLTTTLLLVVYCLVLTKSRSAWGRHAGWARRFDLSVFHSDEFWNGVPKADSNCRHRNRHHLAACRSGDYYRGSRQGSPDRGIDFTKLPLGILDIGLGCVSRSSTVWYRAGELSRQLPSSQVAAVE